MKAELVNVQRGGMWLWLLQRLSAVVLLVALVAHLLATHIFSIGELSYENIGERLTSAFFIVIDILLLAASIFHALNGTRMVVLDYWFSGRTSRLVLDICLLVVGVGVFGYGMWALWPWIVT